MAIVKHIAVHTKAINFLRYITNADKTKGESGVLIHGLNCSDDPYRAYIDFRRTYEHCTGQKFENDDLPENEKNEKSKILMHHYVQSFKPGEVTPEQANAIGIEWAKKVFGENFQILVTTHIDKEHIHNHIAVCPYSLDGKKWNSNKTVLKKMRKISDEICAEHGLSVIENPKTANHMKYKEWDSRRKGTSWKAQICEKIDKLILEDDVNSIDDLAAKLKKEGCNVRLGKYMTIRLPNMKRGIRTENLDKKYGGYSIAELEYRIQNKNKEISFEAISQLHGEERKYAIYMRQMQISVYHTQEHKHTYSDLLKSAELLRYIAENSIGGLSDFEKIANEKRQTLYDVMNEEKALRRKLDKIPEADIDKRAALRNELNELLEKKKTAKSELNHSEQMINEYKRSFGLAEYEESQREYEKLRELAEEGEQMQNQEENQKRESNNRDNER